MDHNNNTTHSGSSHNSNNSAPLDPSKGSSAPGTQSSQSSSSRETDNRPRSSYNHPPSGPASLSQQYPRDNDHSRRDQGAHHSALQQHHNPASPSTQPPHRRPPPPPLSSSNYNNPPPHRDQYRDHHPQSSYHHPSNTIRDRSRDRDIIRDSRTDRDIPRDAPRAPRALLGSAGGGAGGSGGGGGSGMGSSGGGSGPASSGAPVSGNSSTGGSGGSSNYTPRGPPFTASSSGPSGSRGFSSQRGRSTGVSPTGTVHPIPGRGGSPPDDRGSRDYSRRGGMDSGYHGRGLRKSPSYDGFPANRGYQNEPPYGRRGRSSERPGRFDPPGYRRRSPDTRDFRRRSRSRDRDWDRDRERRESTYKPPPRAISTYDMDAKQREEEAAKYKRQRQEEEQYERERRFGRDRSPPPGGSGYVPSQAYNPNNNYPQRAGSVSSGSFAPPNRRPSNWSLGSGQAPAADGYRDRRDRDADRPSRPRDSRHESENASTPSPVTRVPPPTAAQSSRPVTPVPTVPAFSGGPPPPSGPRASTQSFAPSPAPPTGPRGLQGHQQPPTGPRGDRDRRAFSRERDPAIGTQSSIPQSPAKPVGSTGMVHPDRKREIEWGSRQGQDRVSADKRKVASRPSSPAPSTGGHHGASNSTSENWATPSVPVRKQSPSRAQISPPIPSPAREPARNPLPPPPPPQQPTNQSYRGQEVMHHPPPFRNPANAPQAPAPAARAASPPRTSVQPPTGPRAFRQNLPPARPANFGPGSFQNRRGVSVGPSGPAFNRAPIAPQQPPIDRRRTPPPQPPQAPRVARRFSESSYGKPPPIRRPNSAFQEREVFDTPAASKADETKTEEKPAVAEKQNSPPPPVERPKSPIDTEMTDAAPVPAPAPKEPTPPPVLEETRRSPLYDSDDEDVVASEEVAEQIRGLENKERQLNQRLEEILRLKREYERLAEEKEEYEEPKPKPQTEPKPKPVEAEKKAMEKEKAEKVAERVEKKIVEPIKERERVRERKASEFREKPKERVREKETTKEPTPKPKEATPKPKKMEEPTKVQQPKDIQKPEDVPKPTKPREEQVERPREMDVDKPEAPPIEAPKQSEQAKTPTSAPLPPPEAQQPPEQPELPKEMEVGQEPESARRPDLDISNDADADSVPDVPGERTPEETEREVEIKKESTPMAEEDVEMTHSQTESGPASPVSPKSSYSKDDGPHVADEDEDEDEMEHSPGPDDGLLPFFIPGKQKEPHEYDFFRRNLINFENQRPQIVQLLLQRKQEGAVHIEEVRQRYMEKLKPHLRQEHTDERKTRKVLEITSAADSGPATPTPVHHEPTPGPGRRGRNAVVATSDIVRSEAEMEQVLLKLRETDEAAALAKARLADLPLPGEAIVPDMILTSPERRMTKFADYNNLIVNKAEIVDLFRLKEPPDDWDEEECEIFNRAFLETPKMWGAIARGIKEEKERRGIASPDKRDFRDCILHYYRTKKERGYKAMMNPRGRKKKNKGGTRKTAGRRGGQTNDDATPRAGENGEEVEGERPVTDSGRPKRAAAPVFQDGGVVRSDGKTPRMEEVRETPSKRREKQNGTPAASVAGDDTGTTTPSETGEKVGKKRQQGQKRSRKTSSVVPPNNLAALAAGQGLGGVQEGVIGPVQLQVPTTIPTSQPGINQSVPLEIPESMMYQHQVVHTRPPHPQTQQWIEPQLQEQMAREQQQKEIQERQRMQQFGPLPQQQFSPPLPQKEPEELTVREAEAEALSGLLNLTHSASVPPTAMPMDTDPQFVKSEREATPQGMPVTRHNTPPPPGTNPLGTPSGARVGSVPQTPMQSGSLAGTPKTGQSQKGGTSSYWSVQETTDFPGLLRVYGTQWPHIAEKLAMKTTVMVRNYYTRQIDTHHPEWKDIAAEADKRRSEGLPPPPIQKTIAPLAKKKVDPITGVPIATSGNRSKASSVSGQQPMELDDEVSPSVSYSGQRLQIAEKQLVEMEGDERMAMDEPAITDVRRVEREVERPVIQQPPVIVSSIPTIHARQQPQLHPDMQMQASAVPVAHQPPPPAPPVPPPAVAPIAAPASPQATPQPLAVSVQTGRPLEVLAPQPIQVPRFIDQQPRPEFNQSGHQSIQNPRSPSQKAHVPPPAPAIPPPAAPPQPPPPQIQGPLYPETGHGRSRQGSLAQPRPGRISTGVQRQHPHSGQNSPTDPHSGGGGISLDQPQLQRHVGIMNLVNAQETPSYDTSERNTPTSAGSSRFPPPPLRSAPTSVPVLQPPPPPPVAPTAMPIAPPPTSTPVQPAKKSNIMSLLNDSPAEEVKKPSPTVGSLQPQPPAPILSGQPRAPQDWYANPQAPPQPRQVPPTGISSPSGGLSRTHTPTQPLESETKKRGYYGAFPPAPPPPPPPQRGMVPPGPTPTSRPVSPHQQGVKRPRPVSQYGVDYQEEDIRAPVGIKEAYAERAAHPAAQQHFYAQQQAQQQQILRQQEEEAREQRRQFEERVRMDEERRWRAAQQGAPVDQRALQERQMQERQLQERRYEEEQQLKRRQLQEEEQRRLWAQKEGREVPQTLQQRELQAREMQARGRDWEREEWAYRGRETAPPPPSYAPPVPGGEMYGREVRAGERMADGRMYDQRMAATRGKEDVYGRDRMREQEDMESRRKVEEWQAQAQQQELQQQQLRREQELETEMRWRRQQSDQQMEAMVMQQQARREELRGATKPPVAPQRQPPPPPPPPPPPQQPIHQRQYAAPAQPPPPPMSQMAAHQRMKMQQQQQQQQPAGYQQYPPTHPSDSPSTHYSRAAPIQPTHSPAIPTVRPHFNQPPPQHHQLSQTQHSHSQQYGHHRTPSGGYQPSPPQPQTRTPAPPTSDLRGSQYRYPPTEPPQQVYGIDQPGRYPTNTSHTPGKDAAPPPSAVRPIDRLSHTERLESRTPPLPVSQLAGIAPTSSQRGAPPPPPPPPPPPQPYRPSSTGPGYPPQQGYGQQGYAEYRGGYPPQQPPPQGPPQDGYRPGSGQGQQPQGSSAGTRGMGLSGMLNDGRR